MFYIFLRIFKQTKYKGTLIVYQIDSHKVTYSLNNDLYIADNNSAISKPAMNLSLQASQNRIGLALNF